MSSQTLGLENKLHEYLLSTSVREPEILTKLREETAQHPMGMMQIAPEQGQFISLLLQLIGAKKTLEIGVFTGYSSLITALAIPPDGKIVACDVSDEYTQIARRYWQEARIAHKIDLRIAPAVETLDKLIDGESESFDFAFIDADKSGYDDYYEYCLKLVRPGGLIAIDNVLWSGRVAEPEDTQDNRTKKIRELNAKIHLDKRVNISLVPIADGLMLAMKL
jgi:predicted O-methyltransferase YrrM